MWRRLRYRFASTPSPLLTRAQCLAKWTRAHMEKIEHPPYVELSSSASSSDDDDDDQTASQISGRVGSSVEDFDYQASQASLEAARPCSLSSSIVVRAEVLLDEDDTDKDADRARVAAVFARVNAVVWRHPVTYYEERLRRSLARLHFANERYFLNDRLSKRARYGAEFAELLDDALQRRRMDREELMSAYCAALLLSEIVEEKKSTTTK